jgi:hypothetical protein
VYEQPSLLDPGVVPPSLWPGWLNDVDTRHRFTAKVHRRSPTACWYWTGAIGSDGHGRFRAGSRTAGTSRVVTAHLYAYQLEHGTFTARPPNIDLVVRHRCDEASCQNPAHLHLGTPADNVSDYQTRRWRHHSPLGDARGAAGRARAIRTAIRTADTGTTDAAIAATIAAGHADDRQLQLAIALPQRSWTTREHAVQLRTGTHRVDVSHKPQPDPDLTFRQRPVDIRRGCIPASLIGRRAGR